MSNVIQFGQQPEQTQQQNLMLAEQQRQVAETQSALIIAKTYPRDQNAAYSAIMTACQRPTLAATAVYQYARGGSQVEGASIRLAEAIAQCWGNIDFGWRELTRGTGADGVGYSEVSAFCWDQQSNTRRSMQFRVRHWRDTKKGGYELRDERDLYELMANQAARRVRACILSIIPGDVVEAAVDQCNKTLNDGSQIPLADRIKKMVHAFAEYGVTAEMIEIRLQHKIEATTPQQVIGLAKIFNSIKDGASTPSDWFEMPAAAPATEPAPAPVATAWPPAHLAERWDELTKIATAEGRAAAVETLKAMGDVQAGDKEVIARRLKRLDVPDTVEPPKTEEPAETPTESPAVDFDAILQNVSKAKAATHCNNILKKYGPSLTEPQLSELKEAVTQRKLEIAKKRKPALSDEDKAIIAEWKADAEDVGVEETLAALEATDLVDARQKALIAAAIRG